VFAKPMHKRKQGFGSVAGGIPASYIEIDTVISFKLRFETFQITLPPLF